MTPTEFTPLTAALGGAAIGLSATLLYASIGRIAGISGVLDAALTSREGRGWRLAFLAGLLVGAGLWFALAPGVLPARSGFPLPWLVLAGALVGFGTRLGSGCTSGHGICGLARLSPRSMAAVAVFMGFGVLTVTLVRALLPGGGL